MGDDGELRNGSISRRGTSPGRPSAATLPAVTLILGGARSGKSAHAEALVAGFGAVRSISRPPQPLDDEMARPHPYHRAGGVQRGCTVEAPLELAAR